MNLLVVGGAGYVGSILRSTLEATHHCRHLDLRPVPGAEGRMIVGDVNDEAAVAQAVAGQQALLWLAMGSIDGANNTVDNINAAFDVNVRGFYRVVSMALEAGVQRICLASTLSVYSRRNFRNPDMVLSEDHPPNSWKPYGLTKRLAEYIGQAAAQRYPEATILALRLMYPRSDEDWPPPHDRRPRWATGPQDLRDLFLKALALDQPGYHMVHTSGDVTGERFPNHRATALLGWAPQGH